MRTALREQNTGLPHGKDIFPASLFPIPSYVGEDDETDDEAFSFLFVPLLHQVEECRVPKKKIYKK